MKYFLWNHLKTQLGTIIYVLLHIYYYKILQEKQSYISFD